MADWLADEVRLRGFASWMLVGHSMGGKIATIVAARARDGERGLSGLAGIVLVTASPPSPEPMKESRRAKMIGWFADGDIAQENAEAFVAANIAHPLSDPLHDQAVADVRRTDRQAWLGWLERGSLEDWRDRGPK